MNKQWPNSELLARLLNRELPVEDRKAFDQDGRYSDLSKLIQQTEELELPAGKTPDQAWNQLQARIARNESLDDAGIWPEEQDDASKEAQVIPFGKQRRSRYIMMAVAAAAAIILFVISPNFRGDTTPAPIALVQVATGSEHQVVELPDGSTVTLNAESRISFDSDAEGWAANRTVTLEGEAFFDVEKGSKFRVDGQSIDAQVLGTRFTVYDRDGKGQVRVFEGKVRTTLEDQGWEKDLIAGEMVGNVLTESLIIRKFEPVGKPGWLDGEFNYASGAPLVLVWEELERQYGVDLQWDDDLNLDGKDFFGKLHGPDFGGISHEENLRQALRTVVNTMGFQYKMTESGIMITAG